MSATLGTFSLPKVENEKLSAYAPGSPERSALEATLARLSDKTEAIPVVVNGEKITGLSTAKQYNPSDHKKVVAEYQLADTATIEKAIEGALKAKLSWEAMPFTDRCAIFLKAAELISGKYRYEMLASTMLGQGKNIWQAEIDAIAEVTDFLRFNATYAQEIYAEQPPKHSTGVWNRVEYRPLEGFVYAVAPFNFTAIGSNLPCAPAIMGNVVLWKPSSYAVYSNYLIYEILVEAGLPAGVIQFVPGPAADMTKTVLSSPHFAALHFTGSTAVFKQIWHTIGENLHLDVYRSYPRIVGETGGKNFHMIHESANLRNAVMQTLRAAFEYQGQKCSACSRLYVPDTVWKSFKDLLLQEHKKIDIGVDFLSFMGPVIHKNAFAKIKSYIDWANADDESEIIAGGKCDDSVGYFIHPTIIVTKNPKSKTMCEEIFGPILTIYIYKASEYAQTLDLVNETSSYALTGSIFAQDRSAILLADSKLRYSAGNFYINDKCTGAVVGQQPFGGGRASGTNDKAGSRALLYRFVSMRSIKENFINLDDFTYPSNKRE
ncbi:4352_t:CDS:10 [Paraglomus occultum]|uniref:Multifunctional fusion protein n=1 Tax=Paraglomus occultum TaxID=144539 RepID=A0A9N8ZB06_9GLOM|nr:4352_t:CDS:10 [Paraglomus occultum]